MKVRMTVGGVAVALLLWGPLAGLGAQVTGPGPDGRWPLQPRAPGERLIAPFMEGWYANEDGTYTISFGYNNFNRDTLFIPVGEGNSLDPAEFNGVQPTVFFPGHHRGIFTVTLPAVMKEQDVWWTITRSNGDVTKVPGRVSSNAYELDWMPRPHGTVPPAVWFESDRDVGRGPPGVMAERTLSVAAGSPLTVSINVKELSVRDPADTRFAEALTLRVVWSQLQGPGHVEFTRHESTPVPEEPEEGRQGGDGPRPDPPPEVITVPDDVESTVLVVATFAEPGEYLLLGKVDNWRAPDSSSADQCCWTNGYVRVTVR